MDNSGSVISPYSVLMDATRQWCNWQTVTWTGRIMT